MMILEIKELRDFEKTGDVFFSSGYDGYLIDTVKKTFHILIDNQQDCCEDFGCITSEDNLEDFIGAKILGVRCVDSAKYDEIDITKEKAGNCVDVFDCAFIDFETDNGKLQFAVYNHHNGYYGHDIQIREITKTGSK